MKILTKLERTKATWFLIAICTAFFLFRLPSLIEPYWYGDEGIYQVISLAMNSGWALYADVWDNKPPLLYVTYALFAGDQFAIRLVSLILGLLSALVFFFLARTLFGSNKAAGAGTLAFTLLFGTPYLEGNIANAENFMLPLVLTAGLLIFTIIKKDTHALAPLRKKLMFAGLLLGTAFLFKIVAVFDFAAFSFFIIATTITQKMLQQKRFLRKDMQTIVIRSAVYLVPFGFGFILPVLLAFLYFAIQGTLSAFINAAFFGNISYVGYGNNFIIPQGFLIIKLLLFAAALTLLFLYRNTLTKPLLFIAIWFVFAVFSAFFSQRPYTHYLLVMLPCFCLLVGLLFTQMTTFAKLRIGVVLVLLSLVAVNYFHVFGVTKTIAYYQNVIRFLTGQKSVNDYQAFFDPETPRDYELVSYINTHTAPSDKIFLWGDSPQVYYLSQKLPPGKYTVSYHILQDPNGIAETQAAIDKVQPKFIITLSEAPPLPFRLENYAGIHAIKGAAIYERTF